MTRRLHWRRDPARQRRPPLDAAEADWISGGRRPFRDYSVGSLVPVVFERYARVFHPAWSSPGSPVRWASVAEWSGRAIHPLAQWTPLSRATTSRPAPFAAVPRTGGLPPGQLVDLLKVLGSATTTPDRCYVGVWEGCGWLDLADPGLVAELRLEQRTLLVQEGALDLACRVGWRSSVGELVPEAPTIFWPADHAWFVASDPDLDSTYVGGSGRLIETILRHPGLEAWPIGPADRVTFDSDTINGI